MGLSMSAVILDKELLLSVSKPARYIGGEIGSVVKDWSSVDVRLALCFPDVYEIGMSHLGLRILYDLVNKRGDCLAERVFSPWGDMEEKMRFAGIPLFSLESHRPVREFDILGFSLSYELSYTNVLNALALSGLPLAASARDASYPLVIAGGACSLNPEPMAAFIDAFVIGEAEEALVDILDVFRSWKSHAARQKIDLLTALARVPGVYVPALYDVAPDGVTRRPRDPAALPVIEKRYVSDLQKILDIDRWIVPYIEIVHDRVGIEIMRGCPGTCRFCQARTCFFPLRVIPQEKVLATVRRLYRQTGYEEISLLSLSSSDHPDIEAIIQSLLSEFKEKGVSISLPSLRAKQVVGPLSRTLASLRKTTLTFAPEAGSERLRRFIGKTWELTELFDVARRAYQAGYRSLKLYFMIGLPTETTADLDAIADVCAGLSRLKKEVDGHPARLNVSISNFVPKPHTVFEADAMAAPDILGAKQEYLRHLFKKHKGLIDLKFHRTSASRLEGVLGRGDRSVSLVIQRAFEKGARFDAWDNLFHERFWQEAFQESGVDPGRYLEERPLSAAAPWHFIETGFSLSRLRLEAQRMRADSEKSS